MIGELTTNPSQPLVIFLFPWLLPCLWGKRRGRPWLGVVGKTGAIARPAPNTAIRAEVVSVDWSSRYGVAAISAAEASVTFIDEILYRMRETTRPRSKPRGESQRQDFERRCFIDITADEIAGEPIPHADFAGDIEEQEQRQHIEDGAGDDAADLRHFETYDAAGRGNFRGDVSDQGDHAESRAQIAGDLSVLSACWRLEA